MFETFLSHDYTDPGYGEVHFLMVGGFMIQHYRYSDEALAWIQPLLHGYVEDQITPAELRQLAARDTKQDNRSWAVLRSPEAAPLPRIAWQMTIADVVANVTDAASYREQVKQWVRLTLDQLQAHVGS
jgi:hypothetical protein